MDFIIIKCLNLEYFDSDLIIFFIDLTKTYYLSS